MIVCPFNELKRYAPVIPGLEEALEVMASVTDLSPRTIPLSGSNRVIIQSYNTKLPAEGKPEAHREFLDIQYVVEGEECVGWAHVDSLALDGEFNTGSDIGFYTGHVDLMRIGSGNCYVVFPEDIHMPGIAVDEPKACVKMVVKLKV